MVIKADYDSSTTVLPLQWKTIDLRDCTPLFRASFRRVVCGRDEGSSKRLFTSSITSGQCQAVDCVSEVVVVVVTSFQTSSGKKFVLRSRQFPESGAS